MSDIQMHIINYKVITILTCTTIFLYTSVHSKLYIIDKFPKKCEVSKSPSFVCFNLQRKKNKITLYGQF